MSFLKNRDPTFSCSFTRQIVMTMILSQIFKPLIIILYISINTCDNDLNILALLTLNTWVPFCLSLQIMRWWASLFVLNPWPENPDRQTCNCTRDYLYIHMHILVVNIQHYKHDSSISPMQVFINYEYTCPFQNYKNVPALHTHGIPAGCGNGMQHPAIYILSSGAFSNIPYMRKHVRLRSGTKTSLYKFVRDS